MLIVKKRKGAEAVLSICLTIGSLLLSVFQICLARGAKPSKKIRDKFPPIVRLFILPVV